MLISYIKRGAYNSFFYGLSAAINRVINFLFFPYFLSILNLTDFGIWDFYQTFFSLGTTFLTSCASASLIRFYFLYKDDVLKKRQAIGNSCLIVLISMVVFLLFIFCLLQFDIIVLGNNYVIISLLNIFCFSVFAIMIAYVRIKEKLIIYLILFSAQSLLATGLTVLGVNYGLGISAFFYANFFSLILFLPGFLYILALNFAFSWSLLQEQLKFSVPLLLYSIVYMGFFSIDRFFIKIYGGYEVLGTYALLWRFGILFQLCSIALIDAWPVILYNADKENNRERLLSSLILYYIVIIITLALGAVAGSHCLIMMVIPFKYQFLLSYLPLFFLSLALLDIARILQSGFCLTTQTVYAPVLALITLGIQSSIFFALGRFFQFDLFKILFANCGAFSFYLFISYYYGSKISKNIIDVKNICKIILIGLIYLGIYQLVFNYRISWHYSLLVMITWPIILWFIGIIGHDEKSWLLHKLYFYSGNTNLSNSDLVPQSFGKHYYSDEIVNKKIAIFGPYPPPLGGISVHIERVKRKLEQQNNVVQVFDTMRAGPRMLHHTCKIFLFLSRFRPSIIYYHTPYSGYGFYEIFPLIVMAKLLKISVTIIEHDYRYLASRSLFFKFCFNLFMRCVKEQIFMGILPFKSYRHEGIYIKQKSHIETPFLPPIDFEDNSLEGFPRELITFLNNHSPIMSANGFQIVLIDDKDLYGFEWCVELVVHLKKDYPNIGFVFALSQVGNQAYFNYLIQRIRELHVQNNFYVLLGNYKYWTLLKEIDIFVRPTLADNFGISVEEALYYGKSVIASNVCIRPLGVILFECGNKQDFFEKVSSLLAAV